MHDRRNNESRAQPKTGIVLLLLLLSNHLKDGRVRHTNGNGSRIVFGSHQVKRGGTTSTPECVCVDSIYYLDCYKVYYGIVRKSTALVFLLILGK
jgi:hypothetical protein